MKGKGKNISGRINTAIAKIEVLHTALVHKGHRQIMLGNAKHLSRTAKVASQRCFQPLRANQPHNPQQPTTSHFWKVRTMADNKQEQEQQQKRVQDLIRATAQRRRSRLHKQAPCSPTSSQNADTAGAVATAKRAKLHKTEAQQHRSPTEATHASPPPDTDVIIIESSSTSSFSACASSATPSTTTAERISNATPRTTAIATHKASAVGQTRAHKKQPHQNGDGDATLGGRDNDHDDDDDDDDDDDHDDNDDDDRVRSSSSSEKKDGSKKQEASTSSNTRNEKICVVSWNINGLTDDKGLLPDRFSLMCKQLQTVQADLVLLQEVEDQFYPLLHQLLASLGFEACGQPPTFGTLPQLPGSHGAYAAIDSDSVLPYFTMTFVRSSRFTLVKHTRMPFQGSRMMRDLNIVDVRCKVTHRRIWVGNVHFESQAASGPLRCKQFAAALQALEQHGVGLLAGDTNLRDKEAKTTLSQHASAKRDTQIKDAWEASGKPQGAKYTWDTVANDTLDTSHWKFQPRSRFDRCFLKRLDPCSFRLIGTHKDPHVGFISDHFGLCIDLALQPRSAA